jgi:hypothetical protein
MSASTTTRPSPIAPSSAIAPALGPAIRPTDWLSAEARLIWEGRHYNKPKADQWPVPGFETWYSGGILFDRLALDPRRARGPAGQRSSSAARI